MKIAQNVFIYNDSFIPLQSISQVTDLVLNINTKYNRSSQNCIEDKASSLFYAAHLR